MPCPATETEMKTLISCMVLIVSVSTRLQPLVADNVILDVCENSEYRNGSDFQRNLNQVLESLVGNVSTSGFTTKVEAGQDSNSTVYGFSQCRGDLNSSECKHCASTANARLRQRCHNTSGFVSQEELCLLRYDSHNFYDDHNDSTKFQKICGPIESGQPEQFENTTQEAVSKLIEKAVQSPKLFATDKIETIYSNVRELYSLAQCWGNLSQTKCRSCLVAARSNISSAPCSSGSVGARYLSTHCVMRYEIYPFFNGSIIPSPPSSQPPGERGKRSKVLRIIITLGVLAATLGLIVAIGLWKWNLFSRQKRWGPIPRTRGEVGEMNLSTSISNPELIFNYDVLREATSDFKKENILGEGGFGSVFKGVLPNGTDVAIKRLNIISRQGDTEFLNEANLISGVQHRNLVKLLGCSVQSSERLLVYEYLQNSSLDKILFDTTKRHLLNWRERYEIIVGTARGLAYLHEESDIRIIHRDIKASNILLDNKYRPKIADFGLAKLFAEDQSHVTTRVAGTLGYMAPEYALRGQLTEKADVFSFGVLVLEIISGRKNQSSQEHMEFLIEATWGLYKAERALEIMDPTLEGSYSWEEGIRVIKIGLLCIQAAVALRPSMSGVVSMLTIGQEYISSPTRPAYVDVDTVTEHHQLQPPKVIDPDKTSTSTTTTFTTSGIHSAAADPLSGAMEPR